MIMPGYEPRGLFNVVEFVMNDRDCRGAISLEEALQITYLRHGRAELDAKLEEVFGTSDLNSGKTLCLTEFLACLHSNQVKQLLNRVTARTYRPGGSASGGSGGGGGGGTQVSGSAHTSGTAAAGAI
jgi:calmodulin